MSKNSSGDSTDNGENEINSAENDVETSLRLRLHALEELVSSEEAYVKDLELIVDGYMREIKNPNSNIPVPDDLKSGKARMVFGNIEAIYDWHKE